MAGEEQENQCICIFEKFSAQIKGDARAAVGECGKATSSQDIFVDPVDDQLLSLSEVIEKDTPEYAYGSPHMLDTVMV